MKTIYSATCLLVTAGLFARDSKPETRVEQGNRAPILHLGTLSEPTDVDPHVVTAQQNFFAISALFEALPGCNPKGATPMPAVAEWLAR